MLTGAEWVKLRCFEYELQRLEILQKEIVVRAWLEEEIEKLKKKENER